MGTRQDAQELGKERLSIRAIGSIWVKLSTDVEVEVDARVFKGYVEHFHALPLKHGQVVVTANLSVHKSKRAGRLVGDAEATLLFLSPYWPDMIPTEEGFSKVQAVLKKAGARAREALVEATDRALDAFSKEDVRGFYAGCGCRLSIAVVVRTTLA